MLLKSCEYLVTLNKKLATAMKLDSSIGIFSEKILKNLVFKNTSELIDNNIGYFVICSLFYVLKKMNVEDLKFNEVVKMLLIN